MAYYPKSQIKPNLYTGGNEFTTELNQSNSPKPYIGYYYQVSNGSFYTGKTPQDGLNTPLYPIQTQAFDEAGDFQSDNTSAIRYYYFLDTTYSGLQNVNLDALRALPQSNPTFPTDQDIDLGVYTRYFCKKNNELKYMEIDKTTFEKLNSKSKDIAWDLYTPVSTLWYISGDSGSYRANKGLISLIEKNQKWYGFTQWFKERF
jgi:hypothetical protein